MRLLSPNGTRSAEGESRILAEIIVGRGVAHLDRAALHRIGGLQAGHDLARSKDLDLEFVVGRLGDRLGESFRRSVDRVERFREARRQPPFAARGMDCAIGRLGDAPYRGGGNARPTLQKFAAASSRSLRWTYHARVVACGS